MALISRITTWVNAQLLKSADLNGEFNNLVNTMNNLDSATTTWTNVKVATLNSTTGTTLKGTATNDNAAAGNVGEYISSAVTNVNFPATTAYGDLTSISLTAGDWDVTGQVLANSSSSTWTHANMGISSTTGNSAAGLVLGDSRMETQWASSSTTPLIMALTVSALRVSLSSTTTYYLKFEADYSLGQPTAHGRISARRVR